MQEGKTQVRTKSDQVIENVTFFEVLVLNLYVSLLVKSVVTNDKNIYTL